MTKNSIKAIPLMAYSAALFDPLNPKLIATLPQACFIIKIINKSTKIYLLSYDGIDVHDVIEPGQLLLLDAQIFAHPASDIMAFPLGLNIWATGDPDKLGMVYTVGYYQEN